jgi:broad specificity phosphatase PhoE
MIYLVRHGQTEFNRDGRMQGGHDSPLTELGRAQAARYGELLQTLIDDPATWSFISSPLGRALQTARIIGEITGLPPVENDPRIAEIRMGSWDGLKPDEIDLVTPGAAKGAGRHDFFFLSPDGETYEVFAARVGDWLKDALADPRPRVVVSHGVTGRVLRGLYAHMDPQAALKLPAPQNAIFRLDGGVVVQFDCEPVALASGAGEG